MAGVLPRRQPASTRSGPTSSAGTNAITEVPPERWDADRYFDPDGHRRAPAARPRRSGAASCPRSGSTRCAYGIPPGSLAAIEPVQLLSLEVAAQALADAGYAEREFDRDRASVVFGAESGTDLASAYGFRAMFPQPGGRPAAGARRLPARRSPRTRSPACSPTSSPAASPTASTSAASTTPSTPPAPRRWPRSTPACKELHDSAPATWCCAAAPTCTTASTTTCCSRPCTRCRPPASAAPSTPPPTASRSARASPASCSSAWPTPSATATASTRCIEGVGRLERRPPPRPHRAPQGGPAARPRRAPTPRPASRRPTVGLVEAHGTGTVVGDRTELATLTEVFGEHGAAAAVVRARLGEVADRPHQVRRRPGRAHQGGHGRSTTACCRRRSTSPRPTPPTTPRPARSASSTAPAPGLATDRRAGVSAFGFGGTNFHAVLSLATTAATRPAHGLDQWPAELFLFRAATPGGRRRAHRRAGGPRRPRSCAPTRRRSDTSSATSPPPSRSAGRGPRPGRGRRRRPRRPRRQARGRCGAGADLPRRRVRGGRPTTPPTRSGPQWAFLYPGQGSQRPGMLADLFVAFPRLDDLLVTGERWADVLFPPAAFTPDERKGRQAALTDTRVAQPTLGIAGLAMTRAARRPRRASRRTRRPQLRRAGGALGGGLVRRRHPARPQRRAGPGHRVRGIGPRRRPRRHGRGEPAGRRARRAHRAVARRRRRQPQRARARP